MDRGKFLLRACIEPKTKGDVQVHRCAVQCLHVENGRRELRVAGKSSRETAIGGSEQRSAWDERHRRRIPKQAGMRA